MTFKSLKQLRSDNAVHLKVNNNRINIINRIYNCFRKYYIALHNNSRTLFGAVNYVSLPESRRQIYCTGWPVKRPSIGR